MDTEITQILYSSKESTSFKIEDLFNLLKRSREGNEKRKITGLLIYSNGKFLQVLEGKKEDIDFLYSKIENDSRHQDVNVLLNRQIKDRDFPAWSMAYKEFEKYPYDLQKKIDNLLRGKIRFLDEKRYIREFFQEIVLEF